MVSNTAFSSCFYSVLVGVGQKKTAVSDTVIIYDESYYIRLINEYSITSVIKYSINILIIVQCNILIIEGKENYYEEIVFK